MKRPMFFLAVAALLAAATGPDAAAEKPDLPADSLRKIATHVVVGEVRAIWTRAEREGGWAVTHHVAEVKITAVEKGEGLAKGGLVYARYWTRRWVGPSSDHPASTNGHRGIPSKGESLRIYLARNAYDGFGKTADGGFNVVGANGFERLK